MRFRILLVASLAAVAFALLPFLFYHLWFAPSTTWSISSGMVSLFMIPIAVHDIRAVRVYSDVMPRFDRRAAPLLALVGTVLWISQLANLVTIHAFGPYLAAPMWFLGFSAFQFSRLLLSAEDRKRQ